MSLEVRKPVFDLNAADGAIGSHAATAKDAYRTFETKHSTESSPGAAGLNSSESEHSQLTTGALP